MPVIRIQTLIAAPPEHCFDLARDIGFHIESMAHTGEQAVAGRTSGLIGLGERVTWRARHLGVTQELTSEITAFDPPRYFRDEMVRGAFQSFVHDHYFRAAADGTEMEDVVTFRSPLGPLGTLFDRVYLISYLRRLLSRRCQAIREAAERMG